ncbi:putative uncharacterized hydrolase [Zalerion maritima]|uniref:Uncharacterized hydrolase n=1 Tax=Zalerion maritima TaxID=339359 RepID=A0AAD5WQV0_9PEZI|nr:putative uncharacterized hydrolase [Zalerion maritima]
MKARRFAPLKPQLLGNVASPAVPNGTQPHEVPRLKGVVFDVDGTLCQPQNYMFAEMRSVLGIQKPTDILDHIYGLPTEKERGKAMESIRNIERTAMRNQVAQPGLVDLMDYLDSRGIRKGICTRNFEQPVNHLLAKFLSGHIFEPVVTREFKPPKPDPAGILHIAKTWGLTKQGSLVMDQQGDVEGVLKDQEVDTGLDGKEEGETVEKGSVGDASHLIMVGDSIDDMTAGRRAGAATVLLANEANAHLSSHEDTDMVISRLDELVKILDEGFSGDEQP